jgi:hypothetical protein
LLQKHEAFLQVQILKDEVGQQKQK